MADIENNNVETELRNEISADSTVKETKNKPKNTKEKTEKQPIKAAESTKAKVDDSDIDYHALALAVIGGQYGSGDTLKAAIAEIGADYNKLCDEINNR